MARLTKINLFMLVPDVTVLSPLTAVYIQIDNETMCT